MYDVVLADPPWPYEKLLSHTNQADRHYPLMTIDDIREYPMPDGKVLFLWATGPKLDLAMDTMRHWGYHYRSVAFTWVKTTKDGRVINGKGVRPSITKPLCEYVLAGSRVKSGRPLPVLDESIPSVILSPLRRHSQKPPEVRSLIRRLYGESVSYVEVFARDTCDGWDVWGPLDYNGDGDVR